MTDAYSAVVSTLALAVSAATAWLTLFRRGTVRMTQPTVIYFGPDRSSSNGKAPSPKVFLRTLLFATGRKGRVIESLYVALSRNETHQNFSIWVYGEKPLVRGSGLFVSDTGFAANHHFLVPPDAARFQFEEGAYRLDVFARILGDKRDKLLFSQTLEISKEILGALKKVGGGVYFDWGPSSSRYIPHVESPPLGPDQLLEMLSSPSKTSPSA